MGKCKDIKKKVETFVHLIQSTTRKKEATFIKVNQKSIKKKRGIRTWGNYFTKHKASMLKTD